GHASAHGRLSRACCPPSHAPHPAVARWRRMARGHRRRRARGPDALQHGGERMERPTGFRLLPLLVALATAAATTGAAQQITGVPGSPSATIVIDGKQLPPPDLPFGGKIERNALQSTARWPPRGAPPQDAPHH